MQEETPLAPAQTMLLVILLPQYFLQLVLDRRGRVACCSLSGVLASGRAGWGVSACCPHLPPGQPVVSHHSLVCLVRPQPVVAHSIPAGKLSLALGRHTADTVLEKRAGVASFSRVMSLLLLNMLYLGFLKTCGAGPDSCLWGLGRSRPGQNLAPGYPSRPQCSSVDNGLFNSAAPSMAPGARGPGPGCRPSPHGALHTLLSALPHRDGVLG